MSKLIRFADKRVRIEDDSWTLLREHGLDQPIVGDVIVPAADWLEHGERLKARGTRVGVWFGPAEDPGILKEALEGLSLIAVDFPKFNDGRGYSIAALLRRRYHWKGELRAVGEVLRDQMFYLARAGFDAFAVPEDKDAQSTAEGLNVFSVSYQDSSDDRTPALRNRAEAVRQAKIIRTTNILKDVAARFPDAAFASSLSAEDMVLTDIIARHKLPIHIFTLDTLRLHEETLGMIGEIATKYGLQIEVMKPVQAKVDEHVGKHGAHAMYDSLELRKECCGIRKVEPLNRALNGRHAWITGQRREQAVTRTHLPEEEHDGDRDMAKFNPLADWSWDDVLAYAAAFDVPLNPLHARGYPSIGCEPCTRPVRPGEDPRAGRWWWEQSDSKECGLHTHSDDDSSKLESAA